MSLALKLVNVSKRYGDVTVLEDCSLGIERPGVYALMGPNGSGKSTLLRICALLEDPDGGSVLYHEDGGAVANDIGLARRITLVLPGIGLFNTSVINNAAYGLLIRHEKRQAIRRRVEEELRRVELFHRKDQNALTLSSGEAQRLGIARALAVAPEVLFLDEPTAFVDHRSRGIIDDVLLGMKRDGRSIILLSTHDRGQASKLGDALFEMREGRIEGPAEAFARTKGYGV